MPRKTKFEVDSANPSSTTQAGPVTPPIKKNEIHLPSAIINKEDLKNSMKVTDFLPKNENISKITVTEGSTVYNRDTSNEKLQLNNVKELGQRASEGQILKSAMKPRRTVFLEADALNKICVEIDISQGEDKEKKPKVTANDHANAIVEQTKFNQPITEEAINNGIIENKPALTSTEASSNGILRRKAAIKQRSITELPATTADASQNHQRHMAVVFAAEEDSFNISQESYTAIEEPSGKPEQTKPRPSRPPPPRPTHAPPRPPPINTRTKPTAADGTSLSLSHTFNSSPEFSTEVAPEKQTSSASSETPVVPTRASRLYPSKTPTNATAPQQQTSFETSNTQTSEISRVASQALQPLTSVMHSAHQRQNMSPMLKTNSETRCSPQNMNSERKNCRVEIKLQCQLRP